MPTHLAHVQRHAAVVSQRLIRVLHQLRVELTHALVGELHQTFPHIPPRLFQALSHPFFWVGLAEKCRTAGINYTPTSTSNPRCGRPDRSNVACTCSAHTRPPPFAYCLEDERNTQGSITVLA